MGLALRSGFVCNLRWWSTLAFLASLLLAQVSVAQGDTSKRWVSSWATANKVRSAFDPPTADLANSTVRQIVRVSAGGRALRVWLSNEVGNAPLAIGAASIAPRVDGAQIETAALHSLTFDGERSIVIPAGARVLSDPVSLRLSALSEVAISLFLPDAYTPPTSPVTYHVRALQTSFVAPGDQTHAEHLNDASTITSWFYLAGIDVLSLRRIPVIAALGDSITDGDQLGAPNEPVDLNDRYTDFLAERIATRGHKAAVINLGISGNQITTSFIGENTQGRFDADILDRVNVTHLVLLGGINDIGLPGLLTVIGIPTPEVSTDRIIAGLQQIAAQARARGIVTIGGTLTPSGGSPLPGYSGANVEAKRQAVNTWIRSSGAFDRVVDFDALLRDPADPTRMRADITADGLHPNSAGYKLMADAVAELLMGH